MRFMCCVAACALVLLGAASGSTAADGQATVTVIIAGPGAGWVTSNPAGISCGTICSAQFPTGVYSSLGPQVVTGSTFAGWTTVSGDSCDLDPHFGNECQILLNGDSVIQANFGIKPSSCRVPNLNGQTLAGARHFLESQHCEVGTITHAFSDVREGRIASQNPLAHWQNTPGSKVDLVVSWGKPRPCVVPDLRGKLRGAARLSIEAHACSVGLIHYAHSRAVHKGHVISQTPAPGERLAYRASVNLVVSGSRKGSPWRTGPYGGMHGSP